MTKLFTINQIFELVFNCSFAIIGENLSVNILNSLIYGRTANAPQIYEGFMEYAKHPTPVKVSGVLFRGRRFLYGSISLVYA